MDVDYIIVGQGLGGSILAFQMIEKGKHIAVIDSPANNISSSVAAGLFNPVTGRRFVKTWKADLLFPFMESFYKNVENTLKKRFFNAIPLFRPFLNIEEQNEIQAKNNQQDLGNFVNDIIPSGQFHSVENQLGGVLLNSTGYLDILEFISSVRAHIIKKGVYSNEYFDHKKLDITLDVIKYRSLKATKIIFCEGNNISSNPYFNWLPMKPVKGELIFVTIDKPLDFIYNRKVFILPFMNKLHKVGATYDWKNLDCKTTIDTKNYFEDKLKTILNVNFKTERQLAGIRPASKDRRPFIGIHPENDRIGI